MTKSKFLGVGAGLLPAEPGSAFGQQASVSKSPAAGNDRLSPRKAKTTKLFKSPPGFPNGLAVAPEGLWIGEQKLSGAQAATYRMMEPISLSEQAWLVDWNGKVLKTVTTPSRNTSGMAYGGRNIWMCANAPPEGIYQVDMESRVISHRQIPLGLASDGGGCHGAFWQDGKLWIVALRLRGILRVDPTTWQPEFLIPFLEAPERMRVHGIAWDNGAIWQIVGNDSHNYEEGRPGLVKYDAASGKVLEVVDFLPHSSDPQTGWRCTTEPSSAAMQAYTRDGRITTARRAVGYSESTSSNAQRDSRN
jgi:hypothetical protein